MARWLEQHGVARARIAIENRARFTAENADLTVPLLSRVGAERVTVVTDRSHLRRATFHMRAALRANGLGHIEVQGHGAPDGLRGLGRTRAWLRESAKIVRDAGFRLRTRVGVPLRRRATFRARRDCR